MLNFYGALFTFFHDNLIVGAKILQMLRFDVSFAQFRKEMDLL
jgi:hypothetical protein